MCTLQISRAPSAAFIYANKAFASWRKMTGVNSAEFFKFFAFRLLFVPVFAPEAHIRVRKPRQARRDNISIAYLKFAQLLDAQHKLRLKGIRSSATHSVSKTLPARLSFAVARRPWSYRWKLNTYFSFNIFRSRCCCESVHT